MKKRIIHLMLLFLLVTCVGCQTDKVDTAKSESSSNVNENVTEPETTKEVELGDFEGKYIGGSLGVEGENYQMTFSNDQDERIVVAEENPEIAFFTQNSEGVLVANEELKGNTFKVYYEIKSEKDQSTEQMKESYYYISSEVSESDDFESDNYESAVSEGIYSVIGIEDSVAIAYIEAFQNQIRENDSVGIAKHILYPVKVMIEGEELSIENEDEFEAYYDQIFNERLKEALLNASPTDLFVNYQGIMFGSNEKNIWLNNIGSAEEPLVVIGINN